MSHAFDEVISSRERLREIMGMPNHRVAAKVVDHIDDICRRFIDASPFAVISTRGRDGRLDQSPKGDPAGFVTVLDEKTLAIPDRMGNNRIDTFENVLANPQVGLIFLIPGYGYTLRVSGNGQIVRDARLQKKLAMQGREPKLVLVVTVEEAFMHCAKCMSRSNLWQQEKWPDMTNVPSLAEAMVAHAKLSLTHGEMQAIIDDSHKNRMY
ncbi:MAG: pyridoxamine 5'-phosphate oxidase family protein [Hyphomicrobiaceae bacterium]